MPVKDVGALAVFFGRGENLPLRRWCVLQSEAGGGRCCPPESERVCSLSIGLAEAAGFDSISVERSRG